MKAHKILIGSSVLCMVLFSTGSHATRSKAAYQGVIGEYPIVMELPADIQPGHVQGRYFYVRHRLDISLFGRADAHGVVSLQEGNSGNRLTLQPQPDGGWKGTWTGVDGRAYPVSLHPAILPKLADEASGFLSEARKNEPYVYLRLHDLALKSGSRQQFMGFTLRWLSGGPHSSLSMFNVERGYTKQERVRINQVLTGRLWGAINAYYRCAGIKGDDYSTSVTPTLLSDSIVSASVAVDAFCGGAHPAHYHIPINLAVRSGQSLELSDVFRLDKPGQQGKVVTTGQGNGDTPQQNEYGKRLARWLVNEFRKLYPERMSVNGFCNYSNPSVWRYHQWHFTPKGIFIRPTGFAYVQTACKENDDWSVVPYAVVRHHPGTSGLKLPGKEHA